MDTKRHMRRRAAALKAAQQLKRRGLRDPLFNLREVSKHMILLEDHLCQRHKLCPDCIMKHLLSIEAFAEEAVALDPGGPYMDLAWTIGEIARIWADKYESNVTPWGMARGVRSIRKLLVPLCFNPSTKVARVASVWQMRCRHSM